MRSFNKPFAASAPQCSDSLRGKGAGERRREEGRRERWTDVVDPNEMCKSRRSDPSVAPAEFKSFPDCLFERWSPWKVRGREQHRGWSTCLSQWSRPGRSSFKTCNRLCIRIKNWPSEGAVVWKWTRHRRRSQVQQRRRWSPIVAERWGLAKVAFSYLSPCH